MGQQWALRPTAASVSAEARLETREEMAMADVLAAPHIAFLAARAEGE